MPSNDLILNVKQIAGYSPAQNAQPSDAIVLQRGGLGGPYMMISPAAFVGTALQTAGGMIVSGQLSVGSIQGGSAQLSNLAAGLLDAQQASITELAAGSGSIGGVPIATQDFVNNSIAGVRATSVWSFNGRTGDICLWIQDILRAGGAPQHDPVFSGFALAPTPDQSSCNSQIATTAFVQQLIVGQIDNLLSTHPFVFSFNGRSGDVVLTNDDVNNAIVATGLWAPINSPDFTGVPQAPTAAPGTNTSQIATTAFVLASVAGSVTGVATWNGRTGNVTLTTADVTAAGGAPLSSPAFIGAPTAPLAPTNDNSLKIANTEWVMNQIGLLGAQVTSFNGRTGAITLQLADVTGAGGAPIAGPVFTGAPAAPNPMAGDNSTRIATTAWVTTNSVATFNGRMGAVVFTANDLSAVGGAPLASPVFTGVPTVPTANPGTSTLQAASTAFVTAALAAVGTGVTSFNTRTGAITLSSADLTAAGGALLASPALTGTPTAPTAAPGTNTLQLATTAFVTAAITASTGGVASWNTRTGAVTMTAADITNVGGALLNGPAFSGVPTAPTATAGSNTTQLATCAFVTAAVAVVNTALGNYLPLAGGTLTGGLTAPGITSSANLQVNSNLNVSAATTLNSLSIGGGAAAAAGTAHIGSGTTLSPSAAALTVDNATGTALQVQSSNNAAGAVAMVVRSDRGDGTAINFLFGTTAAGSIRISSTPSTSYNTTSDYRLKTTYGPAETGAMIDAVPVYDAAFNTFPDDRQPMFLAHELQEVCPWAVTGLKDAENDDGTIDPQGVDASKLVAVLWAEIKNLRGRVAALEAA